MKAAGLAALVTCIAGISARAADAWKPVPQPDLEKAFEAAPPLNVENLGVAVKGVDTAGVVTVPNPDGKSHDVMIWYRKAYRKSTRLYVVDLGTGKVTRQTFEKEEGKVRVEQGLTWWRVLGPDGRLYGADPDWSKWRTGGAMNIYRYDPSTNRVELFKVIPGVGGERNPMALGPDGWIYGAGTFLGQGPDRARKAAAFGFNPLTGEVRNYGAVGPRINGTGYGYSMAVCDRHIYVACGQIPWYLVAVNIKTGEQKVLLEAPEGGYIYRMWVQPAYPGAIGWVKQSNDAPRRYYWLYHGRAIPKTGDKPPWKPAAPPLPKAAPAPEIYRGQLYPDARGRAVLWWRPAGGKGPWRAVPIEGVEKHPLALHRLLPLPDGRLFGTAQGYKGRFLYEPAKARFIELGDGGASLYALTFFAGKVYWSGYPSAPVYAFDPARPWTLKKGGPPGTPEISETDGRSNPRRVHEDYLVFYRLTRVKKMLSAAVVADGRIYFGGKGQRDYAGGGLGWLDPKTGKVGGMWKPFARCPICWLAPADGGRRLLISTRNEKVFLYDVAQDKILREMTPVPGVKKAGPVFEVAPGRLLGITDDPNARGAGLLYGLDEETGEVLFHKRVPRALPFVWAHGIAKWDFRLGPDGFVWATLGNVLVRIDPKDVRVHVLGTINPPGKLAFVGKDLYLAGTEQLRRVKNIVP